MTISIKGEAYEEGDAEAEGVWVRLQHPAITTSVKRIRILKPLTPALQNQGQEAILVQKLYALPELIKPNYFEQHRQKIAYVC